MDKLIDEFSSEGNAPIPIIKKDLEITRDMITIDVQVTRKPLDKIKNINDWDKGFTQGHPYYEQAESLRKCGSKDDILESISLMDLARENGYCSPALYDSYAKAYRKIKDYQNEILICEEGIERLLDSKKRADRTCVSEIEARKNKAIQLLYKQQNLQNKAKKN